MKRKLQRNVLLASRSDLFVLKLRPKLTVLLAVVITILGSLIEVRAQRVEYVKGVLIPTNLKEGDRLKVGDLVATTSQGRIILAYSWATAQKDLRCEAYWIMNGGLRNKVPDLEKPPSTAGGAHPVNCGGTTPQAIREALSENATGISTIAFSGYPGKGPGDPTDIFGRSIIVRRPLESAIDQGISQLPRTFSGRVVSLNNSQFSLAGYGNETFVGQISNEAKVQGGESPHALVGTYVYVEYFKGNPNRVRTIMPTNNPQYYSFLGFHEEQSYSGDCANLKQGQVCLTFDDKFVWLIDDQKPTLNQSESRDGLTIQSAVSSAAQYLHISGTKFVNKVAFHDDQ